MGKGLTVPKWVLMIWPKKTGEYIFPICLPQPKGLNFIDIRLHWAFVVRVLIQFVNKKKN